MPRASKPRQGPFPAVARVGVILPNAVLRATNEARTPLPGLVRAFGESRRALGKSHDPVADREPLPHVTVPIRCADGRSDGPFSGSWISTISALAGRALGKGPAA